jgi:hypothetical protein
MSRGTTERNKLLTKQIDASDADGAASFATSYEEGAEPFVVIRTDFRLRRNGAAQRKGAARSPRFPSVLRGYGLNKIAWHAALHCAGAEYRVLHNFFVVHSAMVHADDARESGPGRAVAATAAERTERKLTRLKRVGWCVARSLDICTASSRHRRRRRRRRRRLSLSLFLAAFTHLPRPPGPHHTPPWR